MELRSILDLMYRTKDKREKKETRQRWLYKIVDFMSSKNWPKSSLVWPKSNQGQAQKIKRD